MNNRTHLLLHPIFLISLFILLINDHVLKAAYPSFLTGKLSDFAGLFVFAVFAAVVGQRFIRSRRSLILLHISIGVAFALFKVAPIEILWNVISLKIGLPLPGRVKDATDLIALSVLPLSYWFIRRYQHKGFIVGRKRFEAIAKSCVLLISAIAIIATTPAYRPSYTVDESVNFNDMTSAELLFNIQKLLIKQGFEVRELSSGPYNGATIHVMTFYTNGKRILTTNTADTEYEIELNAIVYVSELTSHRLVMDSISTRIWKPEDRPDIVDTFVREYMYTPIRKLVDGK